MVTYPTNLTLSLANLDPAFFGTPQEFAEHMLSRLAIVALTQNYGISIVSSLPVANEGPVLLGGTKLYVWYETLSQYGPLDIVDSLGVNAAGKYVLTTDAGVLAWKSVADLWSWSGVGIASLAPGAAGTIAYSNGTVNAWGAPDVALPAKSVRVTKLLADPADAGKSPVAQSDGSVLWTPFGTARSQVATTAEYAIPNGGAVVSIPRPSGAVRIQAKLVAKTTPLFVGASDYGWTVGAEVDLADFALELSDGARTTAFVVSDEAGYWVVCRQHDYGNGNQNIELPNRATAAAQPVVIDTAKWKIIIRYL